jgi:hypothetical protein
MPADGHPCLPNSGGPGEKIPGALTPTPRLWGVVPGPEGPVTVVAADGIIPENVLQWTESPVCRSGRGWPRRGPRPVGQPVTPGLPNPITVDVIDTFPADTSLATHDLVWTSPDDARQLLGLAPGQASDLAVHLFRQEEEQAILADLAAAFPWPVRITGRSSSALRHHTRAVRTGGIAMVAGIPALLAFC